MEKSELIKALRSEMEARFDHNSFRGDFDGRISAKMECDFDLPEGWGANVTISAHGYEHTDRGDNLTPPCTSGTYWVDAVLATFYDPDGAKAFELRYEKELTIKIEY